jgi:hypothetical protein
MRRNRRVTSATLSVFSSSPGNQLSPIPSHLYPIPGVPFTSGTCRSVLLVCDVSHLPSHSPLHSAIHARSVISLLRATTRRFRAIHLESRARHRFVMSTDGILCLSISISDPHLGPPFIRSFKFLCLHPSNLFISSYRQRARDAPSFASPAELSSPLPSTAIDLM